MNEITTDAKNIAITFSDAIKIAKSLNAAIKNMCPACMALVQTALSEEEGEVPTIQQAKAAIIGGQKAK